MSVPPDSTPESPLARGSLFKRAALLLVVGGVVFAALVWWGGGTHVLTQIQRAHPGWIAAAFVFHYVGFGFRGLRWQWILRAGGAQITPTYATSLVISGWFFNSIAPARAGDLLRVAMLRYGDRQDDPVRVGAGVGALVAERALDLLAILALSGFFSLLLVDVALPPWLGLAYGVIAFLLIMVVCGVLIAPRVMQRITARWARLQDSKITELVEQTIVALRAVAARPGRLLGILVMSLLVWLCDAAILWASVQALTGNSTFQEAEFVGLTSALAAAAPVTPGAMGQIEAAYAALLILVGENAALAPSIILLSRGISYWLFLPVSGLITVAAGLHRFLPLIARSRAAASDLVGRRPPAAATQPVDKADLP
ncbi:MAG: lysylphosphatidylglycerol synthase transmembrane domain-containing protein [Litorilinea sp.]